MKLLNVALVFFGSLLCVPNEVYSETYAVLFTGVNEYSISYGFEAAVARVYDTIYKQGIPKKNIITISPNSAPYHRLNPFPGVLMHGTDDSFEDGKVINYFEHVEVDYDPLDLTPETFFEIMAGNKSAVKDIEEGSGRVLQSGPKDTVLVYFVTFMMWGFVLFNNARLMKANQFLEGFDKLREQKSFGQLKIIFEANYAATVFDDYLDTDRSLNIVGYTMGGRMTRLYACEWNYYVNALTGLCSTVGFFEVFDKILKQSNSEKLACFDLFAEHRKFISEMPFVDAPNIYGRQELAGQSIGTFYGKKGKRQAGKTEQNEERNSSAKDMIANSVKNGRTVEDFVLDKYISSAEERNYVKSTVPKIVAKVIKGTSIKERDFNERRINKLSEKKMKIYEDIVYTVKDNCFKDQKLFILTVQPFEQLAILVDMDVSFDQIEKAVKSVCLKDK